MKHLVLVLFALGFYNAAPTVSSAGLSDCHTTVKKASYGGLTTTVCWAGSGWQRAVSSCWDPTNGRRWISRGSYVSRAKKSWAYCYVQGHNVVLLSGWMEET